MCMKLLLVILGILFSLSKFVEMSTVLVARQDNQA